MFARAAGRGSLILWVLTTVTVYATTASAQSSMPANCVASDLPGATCNMLGGSNANQAAPSAAGATISGGGERYFPNRVTGDYGTIAGGLGNQAGDRAVVGGGSYNAAIGYRSAVGGGASNTAQTAYSTIAGGENNIASYFYATIGGGGGNAASGKYSTIAGGSGNIASFTHATVAGGSYNTASGINSTIGGGNANRASGSFSTVGGGSNNRAAGFNTLIAGGSGNTANGDSSTIGGGLVNRAYADYSAIAGGNGNVAGMPDAASNTAHYASIGGGAFNTALGAYASIPGGLSNLAAGDFSFAAGRRAQVAAAHTGTFLFADSNDQDFKSSAANEFAVRASGGIRFVTAINSAGEPMSGVRLAPGSGAWSTLSDRNAKANLAPADAGAILAQLRRVPISTWSYKAQAASIRHIGPMAEDFRAFGFGEDAQYIDGVDENGVALAAIQELDRLNQQQANRIVSLETDNAAIKARLDALDARVAALEQNAQTGSRPVESANLFVPSNLIVLVSVSALGWLLQRRQRN